MVGLSGGGGDWFRGESPVGGLNSGGEGMQVADFSLYGACKVLPIGTA